MSASLDARIDRAIAEIGPRLDELEQRVLELESKQREPLPERSRSTVAGNLECAACGHRIGKTGSANFVGTLAEASRDRILCDRCMNNSAHLHARFWPDCEDDWHDLHDHHSLGASFAGAVAVLEGKVKP